MTEITQILEAATLAFCTFKNPFFTWYTVDPKISLAEFLQKFQIFFYWWKSLPGTLKGQYHENFVLTETKGLD